MVRTIVEKETADGVFYREFAGLSTDDKPTGWATGSLFLEVDTGDMYAYDEEGGEWDQIAALGGSGS